MLHRDNNTWLTTKNKIRRASSSFGCIETLKIFYEAVVRISWPESKFGRAVIPDSIPIPGFSRSSSRGC
jgi:hypothetical protein